MTLARRLIAPDVNAMLFKTVTQWLRTGVLGLALFGLLLLGEAVLAIHVLESGDGGAAGRAIFTALQKVLYGYIVLVAINSAFRTAREMRSGVFQLYALTGLNRDQVVWGILQAMFAQLLFGMFCLAPYMFFAYLMGGVDFLQLVGALLTAALAALPINLLALTGAFKRPGRTQPVAVVGVVFGGCLLIMITPVLLMGIAALLKGETLRYGLVASIIQGALAGDVERLAGGLFMLLLYVAACGLLYFMCTFNLMDSVPALMHPGRILNGFRNMGVYTGEGENANIAAPETRAAGGAQ